MRLHGACRTLSLTSFALNQADELRPWAEAIDVQVAFSEASRQEAGNPVESN